MKNKAGRFFLIGFLVGAVALVSGCKSKNPKVGIYGSDSNPWGVTGGPAIGSIDIPMEGEHGNLPADGQRGMFESVLFAYDSSQVQPGEVVKVEQVAGYLNKGQAQGVIVEGHCDERGSREYNLALGERRALAVRDYLIGLGVDTARIQTKSYGEEMPVAMGHDESSYSLNRRSEFVLY
ncbi:MAG: OmpA family protein [Kiritimatiellales bacterium]|nr:OmpA family protein [Kiritimatiellales bacterium]